MPISRTRAILQTAFAATAILAIVVAVPVLLVVIGGWPLPQSVPTVANLATRLRQGDIPADVVVKALVVVVWIIWLQLMWSLIWEVSVNLRRIDERRPRTPAPLVAPSISAGMGRLVAMIFSASVVVASIPTPVLATQPHPVATHVASPAQTVGGPAPAVDEPSVAIESYWIVQSSDSLWRIAEQALGDGSRASEIIDLNAELQSPRDVRAGQRLRLPTDAVIPADHLPAQTDTPGLTELAVGYLAEAQVVIEPGDTLWDLSHERLHLVDPDGVDDREVLDYVNRMIDRNADIVEDPNLIYPGELFTLPEIGEPPPVAEPVPPKPVPPDPKDTPPTTQRPAPETPTTETPTPPPVIEDQDLLPKPVPDRTPTLTTTIRPPPQPSRSGAADADLQIPTTRTGATVESTQDMSLAPWAIGLAGSTALASGLLVTLRRRRDNSAVRGAQSCRRAPTTDPVEAAIVAASDVPLLRWARHELALLFSDAKLPQLNGTPVAVEMSEQAGIELLWSAQNPTAPRPWEAADDGWTWRATYDANLQVRADALPTALPGLVTVGQRQGKQLLIDLEALGTINITGDHEAVADFVRSLVVELSTDEILADTYVHLVDGDETQLPASSRLLHRSEDDAVELARHVIAEHTELLDSADVSTTFDLRRGNEATGRELTVLVVSTDEANATDFEQFIAPHRGVAVVTTRAEASGPSVTIEPDGSAHLDPLGLRFEAAALPAGTTAVVAELLDQGSDAHDSGLEADDAPPVAVDQTEIVGDVLEAVGLTPDGASDEATRPLPPEVLVSVLGPPIVDSFPTLGRMDTNLLAYLACNGGEAGEDQLIDAVWNGRMVERATVWNRISKTRSIIGHHLPAREQGSNRVQLATSIGTDLAYFAQLVDYADDGSMDEAIELLTEAIDLVNGRPFDAAGYDWAHQQQHHARACELIESTALRIVDLALDTGELDVARHGITQTLRALPANEPLYRARMSVEAAADNPAGVCSAYDELRSLLAELSEDGFDFEPSKRTTRLRADLLTSNRAQSA